MSTSVTTTVLSDISYTFTDSTTGMSISESSSIGFSSALKTGVGTGATDQGVRLTGYLPAGGATGIDFSSFTKTIFGGSYSIDFSAESGNVKGVVISNDFDRDGSGFDSADQVASLGVCATGSGAFTGLFAGGTGMAKLTPNGTWIFNDPFGIVPTSGNKIVYLQDLDGSGVPFSMIVVGNGTPS
jgi:hypothetical protein